MATVMVMMLGDGFEIDVFYFWISYRLHCTYKIYSSFASEPSFFASRQKKCIYIDFLLLLATTEVLFTVLGFNSWKYLFLSWFFFIAAINLSASYFGCVVIVSTSMNLHVIHFYLHFVWTVQMCACVYVCVWVHILTNTDQ